MTTSSPSADSRLAASLAHILGIVFGFIASLIIYLVKKDDEFVLDNAREALNFQITIGAGILVNSLLGQIVPLWFLIGWAVGLGLGLASIVWSVMGFLAARDGRRFRYPISVRLVS